MEMCKLSTTSVELVGRRCTWNVYGIQYTGTIRCVITKDGGIYKKGDWLVRVDGSGHGANVIGDLSKLLED